MRRVLLLSVSCARMPALVGLVTLATAVYAQTITTFDMPNSTSTQPAAINAKRQITGVYVDAVGRHGFLRQSDGTLISFDAPYPFTLPPGQSA